MQLVVNLWPFCIFQSHRFNLLENNWENIFLHTIIIDLLDLFKLSKTKEGFNTNSERLKDWVLSLPFSLLRRLLLVSDSLECSIYLFNELLKEHFLYTSWQAKACKNGGIFTFTNESPMIIKLKKAWFSIPTSSPLFQYNWFLLLSKLAFLKDNSHVQSILNSRSIFPLLIVRRMKSWIVI